MRITIKTALTAMTMLAAGKNVARIDKNSGVLCGYAVSGSEAIADSFKPNFWRAGTDNDR